MLQTAFLTEQEQQQFSVLPKELRDGWSIELEKFPIKDSEEKRLVRMSLLRIRDPKLTLLREKAENGDIDALIDSIKNTDLSGVNEEDLQQIFFAIGPVTLTKLIEYMIPTAQIDKEVEGVTALTVIRHSLLSAQNPQ